MATDENLKTALFQIRQAERKLAKLVLAGKCRNDKDARQALNQVASLCHVVIARVS